MTTWKSVRVAALCALAMLCSTFAFAQIDARMFRQPSVSKDQIAFVYAYLLRKFSKGCKQSFT